MQIDLLLDRADRTIDICEIKYSDSPYELDKPEHERVKARRQTFIEETRTRKRSRLVMITFAGLKHNKYWGDVQSEVTLGDLFKA